MALYVGTKKVKVRIVQNNNGVTADMVYKMTVGTGFPKLLGTMLMSGDNLMLTDSTGAYLTIVKENG